MDSCFTFVPTPPSRCISFLDFLILFCQTPYSYRILNPKNKLQGVWETYEDVRDPCPDNPETSDFADGELGRFAGIGSTSSPMAVSTHYTIPFSASLSGQSLPRTALPPLVGVSRPQPLCTLLARRCDCASPCTLPSGR